MKKQAFLTFVTALMAVGQDAWTERMSLANRLQQQGRYSEARELYLKAVAETGGDHGNSQRRAQALNNLAAHYFEAGKYSEAEPMYVEAIEQWRGLGQTGQLGITYSNLATLYRKTGRYKLAIETFAEAEHPIRETFGPQSPEMVSYLVNLTEAYRASNRLDDAESSAARLSHYRKRCSRTMTFALVFVCRRTRLFCTLWVELRKRRLSWSGP